MSDNSCVQVALRIRPLVPSEIGRGCKSVLEVFHDVKQVQIADKAFTFNHVFASETSQNEFYEKSVEDLVPNLFKGYNVTILAYGQTGSGKTHSMGTAYNGQGEMGIIPRAVHDIFTHIGDNFAYDYVVKASFVELYQEVLYDLLSSKPRDQCVLEVREDTNKNILIPNLTELPANSAATVLNYLQLGSKGRATSSTNMNAQSSRSHAIFTIHLCMTKKGGTDCKTAKFHLVDLAGSERPKKTGATGQTFKEGVNINKGLFALGNVISALGDEKGAPTYVNFRESVLTRLLKDSLGGNSITMMVVCVSPADYNCEETISSLRYADRARRIKNKPVVNEDPQAGEINKLKRIIQELQLSTQGGAVAWLEENNALKSENAKLKNKLHLSVINNIALHERVLLLQTANEGFSQRFQTLQGEYATKMQSFIRSVETNDMDAIKQQINDLKSIDSQFSEITNETKRSEAEIKHCERSIAKDNDTVNYISEDEIGEQQDSHTAKQIAITAQIHHVTKVLAQKEDLAKQIASNGLYMVDLAEMEDNEKKISELEKEKIELMQQLKQAQGASGKLAEQRRKRVQELELQLADLNRKVQEQSRLIKLKEKDDLKIKNLNQEITNMKAEKVKLVKAMRQESENFRKWKVNRERELSKLQNQERKRLNEIAAIKRTHSLQENVLKRKLEHAAANAKRLKDALALRKNVQDAKLKGKLERLGPWVHQELTIHANLVAAQATVKGLLEDRGTLQEQVDELKENDPENEGEILRLEAEIDARSTQIQELNQKLIEGKDDERTRTRFDSIQTMAEAKFVLHAVFDMTTDLKNKEIEKEHKVSEQEGEIAGMRRTLSEFQDKFTNMEQRNAEVEKDYEEKTLLLLKQLRGVQGDDIDAQTQHRIETQERLIAKLESTIEAMQAEKNASMATLEKNTDGDAVPEDEETPPRKKKRSQTVKKKSKLVERYHFYDDSINATTDDDIENDPDWRCTPLGKQVRSCRDTSPPVQALKRSISGGCGCKSTCSTRICTCRKVKSGCSSACRCKAEICANRSISDEHRDEGNATGDLGDDSIIKKPRLTGAKLPKRQGWDIKSDFLTIPEF